MPRRDAVSLPIYTEQTIDQISIANVSEIAMEWLFVIGGAALVFWAGFALGVRAARGMAADKYKEASRKLLIASAHDRMQLLDAHRREIANLLVWRDPEGFVNLYRELLAETSGYEAWRPEKLNAKYQELAAKYPIFGDFDPFGTRTYILYPEASSSLSDADLSERFGDICRFQSILIVSEEHWDRFKGSSTSAAELEHLIEYVARIEDTKCLIRLRSAMRDYFLAQSPDRRDGTFVYGKTSVQQVPHFAESRYGIHLRDTNAYGLHGIFYHDDGEVFESYYRSDNTFEKEARLRPLPEIVDMHEALV